MGTKKKVENENIEQAVLDYVNDYDVCVYPNEEEDENKYYIMILSTMYVIFSITIISCTIFAFAIILAPALNYIIYLCQQ